MKFIFLLGRILFSLIFIVKAANHFSPQMIEHAKSVGVFMAPVFVIVGGVLSLLGALSMLLGYKVKVGAWLLVLFLIPTTFALHKFWLEENFISVLMHQYCFFKNVSLIGAALMLSYFGAGPFSLDNRKST